MEKELDFKQLSPVQQRAVEYFIEAETDPNLRYPRDLRLVTLRALDRRGWLQRSARYVITVTEAGKAAYQEAITPKGDNWL